jgi:hypothetical protein
MHLMYKRHPRHRTGDLLVLEPVAYGRIGVAGLRFGARIRIAQTIGDFAMGSIVADAEAWDDVCDIPLAEPLDPVRGKYLIAVQSLCDRDSPEGWRY